MTSKRLLMVIMLAILATGGLKISCKPASYVNAETSSATQHLNGVFLLNGYNVRSYVRNDKGEMTYSGISHDYAVLVNPAVNGDEFVEYRMEDGRRVYFYRDTVSRSKFPVYEIKADAKSFVEDEHGLQPKAETGKWWKEDEYLINPTMSPNGCNRIYVNTDSAWSYPKDQVRRMFYRIDLILLNPDVVD
ncbi:MAG: hypothetical protein PHW95_03330 [Patescibacteria group bacterium]|nr:hypothetical protein [Patescibacteria group bacterium]